MAVTGRFDADFGDFKNEVDESTEKLKKMEQEADAVGAAVDKALEPKGAGAGALDQVAGALGQVSGAAGSTATALGEVATASEAAAAGGVAVVSAAEMEAAGFLTLQGQTAETVAELTSAAGAVEVLGAAFIGWKIGRAIADMTGLDKTIGDATAAMLGMGDAAYQASVSGMATLERASEAAGYEIRNMDEAIRVLTERDLVRLKTVLQGIADQQSGRLFDQWNKEIEELTSKGLIPQLTKDLDSHAFSLKQLAEWYRVDAEAIAEFQRQLAKQRAAEKDADSEHLDFLGEVDRTLKAQDDAAAKREALAGKVRELERNHLLDMDRGILGLSKTQQEASQKDFEATVKQIVAHQKLVDTINAENAAAQKFNTEQLLGPTTPDPARDAAERRDASLAKIAADQKLAPEIDQLARILETWLKYDQDVGARGRAASQAPPSTVNVNVSGVFDPATIRQLTDAINQENMRRVGSDRYLPAR